MTLAWWIAVIGMPVVGAIFVLIFRHRDAAEKAVEDVRQTGERSCAILKEEIYNFRLRSAEQFASISYLKDVETRIMANLEKIDKKIDRLTDRNRHVDGPE
jgi:hypothetical protein